MANRAILGLVFLATVLAAPAQAQSAREWTAFRDETMSRYGDPADEPDWEDLLYAAGEAHSDDPGAALDAFARSIGRSRADASRYALVIMRTVADNQACRYGDCEPVDPAAVTAAALAEAAREPSGALLTVIGKNVLNAEVMAAIRAHPARVSVLSDIHAYNEQVSLLALMLLEAPDAPKVLEALRARPPGVDGDPDHWDGWLLAMLEEGQARLIRDGAPVEAQAVYAQVLLSHYLQLGLTEDAIAAWRGQTPALREALPLAPSEGCGVPAPSGEGPVRLPDETCEERDYGAAFIDEMAAALWGAGDRAEADALLARGEARLGGAALMGQAHAAVVDALYRERPEESLFTLYVDGDATLAGAQHRRMDGSGWMNLGYGPAGRIAVGDRARSAGYETIAEAIEARPPYYRSDHQRPTLATVADSFPVPVRERQATLSPKIETAWRAFPEQPGRGRGRVGVIPAAWTESRLPDGLAPWREPAPEEGRDRPDGGRYESDEDAAADDAVVDAAAAADLAAAAALEAVLAAEVAEDASPEMEENPTLPVGRYAVIRLEERGGERLLVYRDSTYDLPGETGAYGLWFDRSIGGVWGEPIYLGLQEHFPYVVTPESRLPLLDGDRLQIEVQVREVDPESISFPPVGLRLKREEDGVVLTASLAELTRDGDADGLSDLVERRLDLDAGNPDMDGDGALDGADPMPQVAHDPSTPRGRTALASAILKQMIGYDAAALVVPVSPPGEGLEDMLASAIGRPPVPARRDTFIVGGDPSLFAGLDLPFRLLVYTPEALRALTERGAPFYPPTVKVYSSLDGRRHYVVWSASWVGGSFLATCQDGAETCEIEPRSSWIT